MTLISVPALGQNPKPVCGIRFLNDFKKHYAFLECLSRGDKLCISERINEKSTTAFASTAGATGAAAAKLASSKIMPEFIQRSAKTVGSKIAWGAIAGGTYFIATKALGGVFGFLADTTEAGDCRDNHPWVLWVKGKRGCEIGYKINDNPVAANFFNLQNESEQLSLLKDPQICQYFFNLHHLIKAQGEMAAAEQEVEHPGLFDDSPEPELKAAPKGPRVLPKKTAPAVEGTR